MGTCNHINSPSSDVATNQTIRLYDLLTNLPNSPKFYSPYIYRFIRSFVRSFVLWFVCSSIHSFIFSFVPMLAHLQICSFISPLMHLFVPFILPFYPLFIRSFLRIVCIVFTFRRFLQLFINSITHLQLIHSSLICLFFWSSVQPFIDSFIHSFLFLFVR